MRLLTKFSNVPRRTPRTQTAHKNGRQRSKLRALETQCATIYHKAIKELIIIKHYRTTQHRLFRFCLPSRLLSVLLPGIMITMQILPPPPPPPNYGQTHIQTHACKPAHKHTCARTSTYSRNCLKLLNVVSTCISLSPMSVQVCRCQKPQKERKN